MDDARYTARRERSGERLIVRLRSRRSTAREWGEHEPRSGRLGLYRSGCLAPRPSGCCRRRRDGRKRPHHLGRRGIGRRLIVAANPTCEFGEERIQVGAVVFNLNRDLIFGIAA
jgi:hypothetical protein